MALSYGAARHLSAPYGSPARPRPAAPTPKPEPRRRAPSRFYAVSWLSAQGHVGFETVMAPAVPLVESTCASVARGTLILTEDGPVAVEDLVPGMMISTVEHGALPLQWVGSYDISTNTAQSDDQARLFRVAGDSFGLQKPAPDLLLAPRAHMLLRHQGCRKLCGADQAYVPIRAYEDGCSVIGVTPRSPVTLFNLAFDRQATVTANGLDLETFHPGIFSETLLDDELLSALMRLFPFARSLEVFGSQTTGRLTAFEAQSLRSGL